MRRRSGIAVVVGVGAFAPENPAHFEPLDGPAADARAFAALVQDQGFDTTVLIDGAADIASVEYQLRRSATLQADDLFLFYFSGHGIKDADEEMGGDEEDGNDELCVVFDDAIRDDVIWDVLLKIRVGVRVLLVFDACFSGDIPQVPDRKVKTLSASVRKAFLEYIRRRACSQAAFTMNAMPRASVIRWAACQANQFAETASRPNENSLFTDRLLRAWDRGRFNGSHTAFFRKTVALMPPRQSPHQAGWNARQFLSLPAFRL